MNPMIYLALASRQRGDAPGQPNPEPHAYEGDRLRHWCAVCGDHMVRKAGDVCPCCPEGGASHG